MLSAIALATDYMKMVVVLANQLKEKLAVSQHTLLDDASFQTGVYIAVDDGPVASGVPTHMPMDILCGQRAGLLSR